ncbi:MAG: hypothetical protein Q8P99_02785 [bacterium]|nr:hypothetical protein [bacterium]MDZ4231419.1 hypothetical protein [Patescibacteria group bacterium]
MLLRAFLVCWFLPGLVVAWIGTLILPPLSRSQQFTLVVILAVASGFVWARYVLPYLRRAQERAEAGDTLGTFPAFLAGVISYEVLELRVAQYVGTLVVSLFTADILRDHVARVLSDTAGAICWIVAFPTAYLLLWRVVDPWLREKRLEMLFNRLGYVGEGADHLSEFVQTCPAAITKYESELLWRDVHDRRVWEEYE